MQNTCGVTSIVAGPSTGKSVLIKGLELSACYIGGFIFTDMSDIIQWHRNPENSSPLRENFENAKSTQGLGRLVDDELIFLGLKSFLDHQCQILNYQGLSLRHLVISGFPRTGKQRDWLTTHFEDVRCAYIDCSQETAEKYRKKRVESGTDRPDDAPDIFNRRWETFKTTTKPEVIDQFLQEKRLITISSVFSPTNRALYLVKMMNICKNSRRSMQSQLFKYDSEACKFLNGITKPIKEEALSSLPHKELVSA